ncbi:hypothetical protein B566_EDAN016177, partial [Ephemera danica]
CTSTFVGEYCQHPNPCRTGPQPRCQNGGRCNVRDAIMGAPSFWCTCPIGFSASLCEIPVANACDSSPCHHGGTCSLTALDKYTCTCGTNCQLQDHCAGEPCLNGASCTSLANTYKCTCPPGYVGTTCAEDVIECHNDPCQRGMCLNTPGSYR